MVGLYDMVEPEELRELGFRCLPLHITQASMIKPPTNIPGNNPARKTPTGNLLLWELAWAADAVIAADVEVELAVDVVEVALLVGEDVVVEEIEELEEAAEASVFPMILVLLLIAQMLAPVPSVRQLYPKGQQLVPQVGSLSVSLVVNIDDVGFEVAF